MFSSTHTCIEVKDLRIEAYVGLHGDERDHPQTVSISIECTLEHPEVPGDDLSHSCDYIPIMEEVRVLALSKRRRLIETFAEEIAGICFQNTNVKSVLVSVQKPHKFPSVEAVGTTRTFERR